MPGFSGATGVPLKQMQDAIAQSTAYINLTDSDNTIAKIYDNYLKRLDTEPRNATFLASSVPAGLLTGDNYSDGFIKGFVNRATTNAYDFWAINAGGTRMFGWRLTITNGTSGSVTNFTEYANTQSTAFASTTTTGLTAASNVTINVQRYLTVGYLKVYSLIFTANAAFARDTALISGFFVGNMSQKGIPTVLALNNASHATHVLYLSNGELRSNDAISNGEQLRCTLVYTA